MKKCIVIGSVPLKDDGAVQEIGRENCYVICADGGLDNAIRFGITPDLMIGDFDSVQNSLPEGIEIIRLKVEKDDTDSMAAVREGLKRGYHDFILTGVLGGERFDHSIANLCVLSYLCHQGCKAVLWDGNCRTFLIRESSLTLTSLKGSTVSVFPFGSLSCTVSYTGMKYPLTRKTLVPDFPLGVSNRIEEDSARIVVHSGNALIIVLS
jgi:thiamine pyrophosphokinase